MSKPYTQPGEKGTDTNQANEDTLTYGVDRGIPGGDFTALSIKKGSTLFTFTGDEAVAIIDVIRTEKLKLLAEVRGRVIGENDRGTITDPDNPFYGEPYESATADKNVLRAELTKLEAEL